MVVVLNQIGLREINQHDAGEMAGGKVRSSAQVSRERRPRIRLGLPDS